MGPLRDTRSIPSMDWSKIIMKIVSLLSWILPSRTSRGDGHAAATLECLTAMEVTNVPIFLNKTCTNMYSLLHADHIKFSFSSLAHLSPKIWVQKSLTRICILCRKSKSSREKRQLRDSHFNHWRDVLYC